MKLYRVQEAQNKLVELGSIDRPDSIGRVNYVIVNNRFRDIEFLAPETSDLWTPETVIY